MTTPVKKINTNSNTTAVAQKTPASCAAAEKNKEIIIDFNNKKNLSATPEITAASPKDAVVEAEDLLTQVKNWSVSVWEDVFGTSVKPAVIINKVAAEPLNTVVKTQQDVIDKTGFKKEFLDNLEFYEGKHNNAYFDGAGNKTIGIGHNISSDKNYTDGDKISDEQVYKLFAEDLLSAKEKVKELTGKMPLSKGKEEALVDLIFNMGPNKIKNTKLLNHIKRQANSKAVYEFNFISANENQVSTSLCKRRIENINSFCDGKLTKEAKLAIGQIMDKAIVAYDKHIAEASPEKIKHYEKEKRDFALETKNLIGDNKK